MTTPADELRVAAQTLREHAQTATPGPWRQHDTHLDLGGHTATVLSGTGNDTQLRAWLPTMSHEPWDEQRNVWADASYIALMGPDVGHALADLLERQAHVAAEMQDFLGNEFQDGALDQNVHNALAVARAINGSAR